MSVDANERDALIVVLAVAHWAHHGLNNELTTQLANRGLGMIGILLTLPLAAALAEASRRLGAWMAGGAFIVAAGAVLLASNSLAHDNHFLHDTATPTPALRAAAVALRRAVPEHGRFVTMRAKSEEPRRLLRHFLLCHFASLAKSDDAGHVQRAGTHAALMAAPINDG